MMIKDPAKSSVAAIVHSLSTNLIRNTSTLAEHPTKSFSRIFLENSTFTISTSAELQTAVPILQRKANIL